MFLGKDSISTVQDSKNHYLCFMSIGMKIKLQSLLIFTIVLLVSCGHENRKEHFPKPNILFILVDDLGKEWVSCYGSESILTPEVDKLAESGLRFENFYSMPQCTPTRVTFLTGQYPFRHGWINHWDVPRWGGRAHFDEQLNPCLPLEMKKAGYKTCIAGKWQIDDFRVEPDALEKCGFDEYCMWTGYETRIPASAERYQNPYIFTKNGSETKEGKFGPDIFRDFIIDFIRENKKQPLFIYYPMVLTHTPLVNTPDDSASDNRGKHIAMVKYTDKITGQLVQVLEEENIRENTIIVWTTDNGTTRGITGNLNGQLVKGGKGTTKESGICAPFIVSWPEKIKPGGVTDALVDMTDLFPTFLELAGTDFNTSEEQDFTIDGKSFKKVLTGKSNDSLRNWILGMGGGNNARLTNDGVENQYVFRDRVVRNKRYKLYIGSNREPVQFYDLKNDPFEQNNIIGKLNAIQQKKYDELAALIEHFPERDNDPIYRENPKQDWDVEITAESEIWKK